MKDVCVVHLVRLQNGIEPFERFLESYRINPGGIDHELLIVFKGFTSSDSKAEYLRQLSVFQHCIFEVSDEGYDITAYFAVVKQYASEYRYFCFLNSFSVIQDHDWLSKLHYHISQPGVGLVGATGSWQSHRTLTKTWKLPIAICLGHYQSHKGKMIFKRITLSCIAVFQQTPFLMNFSLFPNYHIRTNAFMISGSLIQQLKCPTLQSKNDAYKFESGKSGMTAQVCQLGGKLLVVGKDGLGYEMTEWNESKTFWQAEQENLLVSDNQTRDYLCGDAERRDYLTSAAWGKYPSCNHFVKSDNGEHRA